MQFIYQDHVLDIMKFDFFRKKFSVECIKCGKKFKGETELTAHNRTAHST